MSSFPRPVAYDPELVDGMRAFGELFEPVPLRPETIIESREHIQRIIPPMNVQLEGRRAVSEEILIPAGELHPQLEATLVFPSQRTQHPVPAVLSIHGGGMVLGNRFFATSELIELAERYGVVGLSIEYRLAPEHPGAAASEDCYAAFRYLVEHAETLGIDPQRILASGASAGGGLAASVTLMARDRAGVQPVGQLLNTPMLDSDNNSVSAAQFADRGIWDQANNRTGWQARLGHDASAQREHPHVVPAHSEDLCGLPPAYIEVGAAEVFRDEAIDYASRIWAVGGQAELHVYAGAYHGFSGSSPQAAVSRRANALRDSWLRRTLGLGEAG